MCGSFSLQRPEFATFFRTMKIRHPLAAVLSGISLLVRRVGFWLLFLAAGLVLVEAAAGTLFAFENTGSLNTPRDEHTGVLLPDGKVLVAGGRNSSGIAIASAE